MTESFRILAALSELPRMTPWIKERLDDALLAHQVETVLPSIELAVQEIAVNIVEHGYGEAADDWIEVSVLVTDVEIEVIIRDQGPAYDPTEHPHPDPDVPQVGGYGLMIVERLTNDFSVTRDGDTNSSRLCFQIPVKVAG